MTKEKTTKDLDFYKKIQKINNDFLAKEFAEEKDRWVFDSSRKKFVLHHKLPNSAEYIPTKFELLEKDFKHQENLRQLIKDFSNEQQ